MFQWGKWMLGATAAGSMLLTGCANVTSGGPVAPLQEKPDEICIIKNPKVTYRDAVPYLQRAFKLRGIATHVVDKPQQCKKTCPWKLRYSMRRSWDWSTYLGTVNLRLPNGEVRIPASMTWWARFWASISAYACGPWFSFLNA